MKNITYIALAVVLVILFVVLSGVNGANYVKVYNEKFTQNQLMTMLEPQSNGIPPDTAVAAAFSGDFSMAQPGVRNIIIYNPRDNRTEGFVRDTVPFTGNERPLFYQPNVIRINEQCNGLGY